jgi:GAF domain-containing protein
MSLTRKAPAAAQKRVKPMRQDLAAALAERQAELAEARRQQAATAEILRVISQAPTDPQPVFERIVATAALVLRCDMAFVLLREGDAYVHTAGATPEGPMADVAPERFPIDPSANFPSRAILAKTMLHLPDWSLIDLPQHERRIHETFGVSSALYLPLLREGVCIGLLAFAGKRPNMFGPSEIAQAESFRDQALIAIENARLFNETQEALDQQKASAEVLGAISKSVADTAPVFEAIIDACQRLFGSEEIGIYTIGDDDMVRVAAWRGPRAEEVRRDVTPVGESVTGRIMRERRTHHIPDLAAEPDLSPTVRERAERLGSASLLYAPMLSEDRGLGSILVVRSPPKPFSEREKALLQSFADQAAIAIQNARMFEEVQAKTRDLTEALQQQTATAGVLKVISRATFDLQSVLDTLMETAARLCDIDSGGLTIRDGEVFRYAAFHGVSDEFKAVLLARPIIPGRDTIAGRVALEGKVVQVPDLATDPDYNLPESIKLGNIHTSLGVPLLRKGAVVGTITVNRQRVAPFTERQVELLRTFADQAVIAIENARLLEAEQQRSRELAEALQQQTATADVLKVISRSAFDLQPVLETLISSAVELSGAFSGAICVRDGAVFRYRAGTGSGYSLDLQRFLEERPVTPGRGTIAARALLSRKVEEIPDIHDDPEYAVPLASLGNVSRAMLGVPLLREDRVEGALTLTLREPGGFTQRQIELVQTFADQAVIAIENVRLFDEVQAKTRDLEESLAQQTATADVLKAISRTAFDLDTVLETLISTAVRLCDAKFGQIFRRHGDVYRYAASQMDVDPAYLEHEQTTEIRPGRGTLVGRVALENRAVEVADAWNDPEYAEKDQARIGNVRAMLGVPLMRNGEPSGAFALARSAPVPFTKRQVELVTTFADQAVIAIENVRLFDEVQARARRTFKRRCSSRPPPPTC